ncbi:MAG: hypothetical protein HXM45_07305 [Lautropia mirabilis]|jgi:hypothetical protein|nr:hypothetical protein [Lautropia mirabilis]
MKNEEVVNLFKRYWEYQRFVKRLVIAIEVIFFVYLVSGVLFGPKAIGFFDFLGSVLWYFFVLSFIYAIVCSVIEHVMNATVGMVFRYRAVGMLRRQFGKLIRSDFERAWLKEPGIFSIDCQKRFILFSSSETGYTAIRINIDDILSTKIERDISFSSVTQAVHDIDGWSGKGRSVSESVGEQREGISLEIAYEGTDNLPYVVVVPFDEDRISAERAQHMIQMFA